MDLEGEFCFAWDVLMSIIAAGASEKRDMRTFIHALKQALNDRICQPMARPRENTTVFLWAIILT